MGGRLGESDVGAGTSAPWKKMLRNVLSIGALALLASAAFANTGQTNDLVINRVFINPQGSNDDNLGLELFEIKNVGTNDVDLGSLKIALVIVENEAGQQGELDGYYPFTGTLKAGQVLAIRDKGSSGAAPSAFSAPRATSYGANSVSTPYEFFSGNLTTDLSNSGANFLLVSGFNPDPDGNGVKVAFGATLDTTGVSKKFDFKESGTTTDDLWTGEKDAIVVYPDSTSYPGGLDDYTTYLSLPHKVVGTGFSGWTPDYVFRLYYNNGTNDVYDKAMAADVNGLGAGQITLSSTEIAPLDNSGWAYAGATPTTTYATVLQSGNWTDAAGFTGITIATKLYVH